MFHRRVYSRKWFEKLENGDVDLSDGLHCVRAPEFYEKRLKTLLEKNGRQASRELADRMNCYQKTMLSHLHSMEFAENLEPGCRTTRLKSARNNAFKLLRNIFSPRIEQHAAINNVFFCRIITRDEQWCLFEVKKGARGSRRRKVLIFAS